MTDPDGQTAPTAPGPTPEEISARLEALLKRTHALRAQHPPVNPGGPLTITWPPPDRELDRYDVVDVPDESAVTTAVDLEAADVASPEAPSVPSAPSATAAPAAPAAAPAAPVEATPPPAARPDWSELRLRGAVDDSPAPSPWGRVLTVVLALATVLQAGYIWYLHAATPVIESGRIRVDGPDGAEVRIDGRSIGSAPVEHNLDAGDYDVELVDGGRVVRADRISVGPGRTVLLLAPGSAEPAAASAGTSAGTAAPSGQAGTSAAPAPARNPDLVSDTTGAVTIESDPPGLPVTMGGRPRGVTPLTLGKIAPGRHDVLVGTAARQVDVTAGEVATLRVPR